VYVVWVLKARGSRNSPLHPIASLVLGGLLVGISDLALFQIAFWRETMAVVTGTEARGGIAASVTAHLHKYGLMYGALSRR